MPIAELTSFNARMIETKRVSNRFLRCDVGHDGGPAVRNRSSWLWYDPIRFSDRLKRFEREQNSR